MKLDIVLEQGGTIEEEMALTVVPRDIFRKYRGRFNISIVSGYPDVWAGNKYIVQALSSHPNPIQVSPPSESKSNQHILQEQLSRVEDALPEKYGVKGLELTEFRPYYRMRVSDSLGRPDLRKITKNKPYWVVHNGWHPQRDVERWGGGSWNKLISRLKINNISDSLGFLQLSTGLSPDENNPAIKDAVDLREELPFHTILWLIQHSHGVITTSGFFSHAAMAMSKPCVVIAGGSRQPSKYSYGVDAVAAWAEGVPEKYKPLTKAIMPQKYLTGENCSDKGCGSCTIVGRKGCKKLINPSTYGETTAKQPACMYSISVNKVAEAVLGYESAMKALGYDKLDKAINNIYRNL